MGHLTARFGFPCAHNLAALACPEVSDDDGNVFAVTAPGTLATGQCAPGFKQAVAGAPQRQCNSDGTWAAAISRSCERTCGA